MVTLKRLVLLAVALLAACGGDPANVPLADLAAEQEAHDGRVVSTEGVVVPIEDRPGGDVYFVLEDDAGNRVRLVPDAAARRHADQTIAITGTFRFDPDAGRELDIDTIDPPR